MRKQLAFILFLFPLSLFAQIETTLPMLTRVNQASYLNPAILPSYSGSFGIPGLSGIATRIELGGININRAVKSIDNGNLDLNALHGQINESSLNIKTTTNIEVLYFRFKIKKWYYGVNLNTKIHTSIGLSKDMLGFIINGNDFFSGGSADFSTTSINMLGYNELGLSAARNFNRFNVGARAKMYKGLGYLNTSNTKVTIGTPTNITEPMPVYLKGEIQTAGIPTFVDTLDGKLNKDAKDYNTNGLASTKNTGYGIDLGLTYDVGNRLTLAASVIDLGFINFNDMSYRYTFKETNINIGGLTFDQVNDTNFSIGKVGEAYIDTLTQAFGGKAETYTNRVAMPTRYFLSAIYKLNFRNTVGLMFQGLNYNGNFQTAYTISYTRKFKTNFDFTTNYSIVNKNFANVGLGLAYKLGPCQIYFVQDNIMLYINPNSVQYISFRFGINFVWNEIKKPFKVY